MLPLALRLVFLLYCIPLHVSFCWGSAGVCSTRHILSLPGATERLTLFKADINAQGSFDSAVHGCDFVVHMATPTDYTKDPETGVIQAAVNGSLDILSACTYSSSITAASPLKDKGEYMDFVDESCWTNVDLIRREKPPFWVRRLLNMGAHVNVPAFGPKGPGATLHLAAAGGHLKVMVSDTPSVIAIAFACTFVREQELEQPQIRIRRTKCSPLYESAAPSEDSGRNLQVHRPHQWNLPRR